jgi:sugar/nucleoside kinase (ribokinase family)
VGHPPIAVVAGHICLDISPDLGGQKREPFGKTFLPGHLITSGPLLYSSGGSVSNTGLALHRLGVKTRLVAKIGDDLPGKVLRQVISAHGRHLTRGLQVDASENTSYSIIINYPGADRIFIHDPGANDAFASADIPSSFLKDARLFHFGYPPVMRSIFHSGGKELNRIFQNAKQAGLTTSLDMAFPDPSSEAGKVDWHGILAKVLPNVDIFMPSVEEILFMIHRDIYQELCAATGDSDILPLITPQLLSGLGDELVSMGAGLVGLKLGYRGLYLRTAKAARLQFMKPEDQEKWASKEFWAPCFKVNVAGTTGSGDATIAGFLAAFLRGCPLPECIRVAVAVGACNVEAEDALSGIYSWNETLTRIGSGWQQQVLEISEGGWVYRPEHNLWEGPCE